MSGARSAIGSSRGASPAGSGRLLQQRFDVDGERAALDAAERRRRRRRRLPADAEFGVDGITPCVDARTTSFYRIDTALVVPQVPKDSWRLQIDGMVDHRSS